jgi:hypothetical protein
MSGADAAMPIATSHDQILGTCRSGSLTGLNGRIVQGGGSEILNLDGRS